MNRTLTYQEAIKETLSLILSTNPNVFMMGEGINDIDGMFGTTDGLLAKFGDDRIFDVPLAETGITGVAVGAALAGMHPIYCHNRPDFLFLAMDQIVNHAAKYRYMSGGQCSVPLIIWAPTGQGWGSAAQHSQELHGMFMQVPGLKIISPTTPYDAKGMLISASKELNPVLFLDHRRLYSEKGIVPKGEYEVPIGKAVISREGNDVTVVAVSSMVPEAIRVSEKLCEEGMSVEVVDIRSIKPLDMELIIRSVSKTGRLLIVDNANPIAGLASEISAYVSEKLFGKLRNPVIRLSYPDVPTPAAYSLEEKFYISYEKIEDKIRNLLGR